MESSHDSGAAGVRRRAFLTSAAVGAAGLAGCLRRFRTVRGQDLPDQVSLDILTRPADEDAVATELGRTLSDNLTRAGIDTELVLLPEDELRRRVLINQEYDLFVSVYPNIFGPDFLRPLLHSAFRGEAGWQNPFNFMDINVDELLVEQQTASGTQRRDIIYDLQREIVRQQPFIPVAVPDNIRATRTERFGGWRTFASDSSVNILQTDRYDETAETLRLVSTDDRLTRNLNPLAIEYRNRGKLTGLLYDSLGRRYRGEIRPWIASDWQFEETVAGTIATVTLQPELQWHDGEPLTAGDVVFTIEFLQDTTLGEREVPVPAPRFRGRASLIEGVEAVDDGTLEIAFGETNPDVAVRSFTLPILPRSEWEEKTEAASVGGIELSDLIPEALVWDNDEPLGSGPLVFESREEGDELILRRHDDHTLNRNDRPEELATAFSDGIPFEYVSITVVRSNDAALQLLANGEADAIVSDLDVNAIPRIGRSPELELHVNRSRMLYLVGCNISREPLGNPHFRRILARHLDKETLTSELFGGFATPAASPLSGTEWLAPDLQWNGTDPEVPFLGTDGELDLEAVRDAFREVGFEYSGDDELLEQ